MVKKGVKSSASKGKKKNTPSETKTHRVFDVGSESRTQRLIKRRAHVNASVSRTVRKPQSSQKKKIMTKMAPTKKVRGGNTLTSANKAGQTSCSDKKCVGLRGWDVRFAHGQG